MKNNIQLLTKTHPLLIVLVLALFTQCTREEVDLQPASFPDIPEVFIDTFSPGLNYAAFGGSKPTAFDVDTEVFYDGTASMRIEVPDFGDPAGAYAGGVYFTSVGRDLSNYNVLTFWAKASKSATVDVFGFGNDLGENRYEVTLSNVPVNTNWQKYFIPIPNAELLTQEKGMFYYSEGPEDGRGYTIWIDEVQFENLGTVAHGRASIQNGEDAEVTAFNQQTLNITGLSAVFNLPNGTDQVVGVAPAYFTFNSSNTSAVAINGSTARVVGTGQSVITGSIEGLESVGSLTVNTIDLTSLVPPQDPNDVISLFSDAYDNVPVDFFNGYWEFSTTLGQEQEIAEDFNIISYTDLNFVGIQFTNPTIDASDMTHVRLDVWTSDPITPSSDLKVLLVDLGGDNAFGGGDDSSHELTFNSPPLTSGTWVSLDVPLTSFTGLAARANLAQLVLSSASISNLFVDNIYFYNAVGAGPTEPEAAAPIPSEAPSDVISLFSNAYTNQTVDTFRTPWSAATLEQVNIAGNATLKYSSLDFVGIEMVASPIDATEMTHFHLDVWSPNFNFFAIKLVDFGANGVFGGGDDVEHQLNFTSPNQDEWISLDIPLTDFVNLTTQSSIAQIILVGQPTGVSTVFVDNIYFHK